MKLDEVRFDAASGLVPVTVQDIDTGEVLMMAYADENALRLTIETGLAHFWSRSRRRLWLKGEESGNTMEVVEIMVDCDGDAVLYRVRPKGPTCHTGQRTCFHNNLTL